MWRRIGLGLCMAALAGCTADWHKADADREVYGIIAEKGRRLLPEADRFSIEPDPRARFHDPTEPVEEARPAATQPAAATQPLVPDRPLTLVDCLTIAWVNSRDFQQRKETLYLSALTLTGERHEFAPRLSGASAARLKQNEVADDMDSEVSGRVDSSLTLSQALADGGSIVVGFSNELVRSFRGFPVSKSAASLLTVDMVQPLLRGAGRAVAQEDLTQAERNTLYAIRSFTRFRKTFAVDVSSEFYQLLRRYQEEDNFKSNYERLTKSREQSEWLHKSDRLNEIQLGQSRQNELSARNRWIVAQETTRNQLDRLKLVLGLPTDSRLTIDRGELDRLPAPSPERLPRDEARLLETAMASRLDLANTRDQVHDRRRKVRVARDALRSELNLVGRAEAGSTVWKSFDLDFDKRGERMLGLDLDLALDRKFERNDFRESLIDLLRGKRSQMELEDNVKLQVRRAYRELRRASQSYEIQRRALKLAERRVESTNAFRDAGRASTRDLLEAESDLLNAQNALILTIVTYRVAELEFYRDLGTLEVTAKGISIHEPDGNPIASK